MFDSYSEKLCFAQNANKDELCHSANASPSRTVYEQSETRLYVIGPSEDAETLLPFDRTSVHSSGSVPWLSPRTWWCFGKWWLCNHSSDRENAQIADLVYRHGEDADEGEENFRVRENTSVFGTLKAFLSN